MRHQAGEIPVAPSVQPGSSQSTRSEHGPSDVRHCQATGQAGQNSLCQLEPLFFLHPVLQEAHYPMVEILRFHPVKA